MANDNNNINELVAADDDPTVELEIPAFAPERGSTPEAGVTTYDAEKATSNESSGLTVSELKTDLRSHKKTINQLQYDIEQLRSKWLALEAEIGAREAQTEQLNNELSSSREAVVRKEKLLKKRDRSIKSLKSEIRHRDKDFRRLAGRLDEMQTPAVALSSLQADDGCSKEELRLRLARSEQYADSLRYQSQDLIEANASAERAVDNLSVRLEKVAGKNTQLCADLALSLAAVEKLESTLHDIEGRHTEEIRLLRFEVGTAENTIVDTKDLNSQLASDLVDACGFKDELERMLGDVEEQTSVRIDGLQKEISKLHRTKDSYEQKLSTKSEAISILLAELAKKSAQIESIGEIEDVVHDIDERMSERGFGNGQTGQRTAGDRITRVLIGTVGDQVLRFPLFKDRLTIGRTKDNDIQLKVGYVSRRHAVVQTDGEKTRIIDWGSKNGIHVNSKKVAEHFLRHGDTVMIGNARFRYEERKKRVP